jgi:hypothetical protein
MNIYIENWHNYHYEVIESCMILIPKKLGLEVNDFNFFLKVYTDESFNKYITNKYPDNVSLIYTKPTINFDYEIYCTFYPNENQDSEYVFAKNQHVVSHRVLPHIIHNPHIFFLSPLCNCDRYFIPTILPPIAKIKTKFPVFAVQGNITEARRNYKSLIPIFQTYKHRQFIIKFIGRGSMPVYLIPFMDKIVTCLNLNFIEYHEKFNDVYAILPLIDDTFNHSYYTTSLTSSISYGKGYDLRFICSKMLKDIYMLDNAITYSNQDEMVEAFGQALDMFESV